MAKLVRLIAPIIILAALAAHGLSADGVGTNASFRGPVGLVSPYSLRFLQQEKGLAAALDKTRDLGFRYVEFGGDFGGLKPAQFKAELDRRGLVPVGLHFSYDQIRDDVEGIAAAAKVMNVSRIGCAWIPHTDPFDEKQCRAAAAVFNRAGAALAKRGLQLYYHTHGYEFRPLGKGTVFDLLAAETSAKTLMFEIDVAWVALPGQDPAELIKKYPDRWLFMHVKDLKKGVPQNHLVKAALTDQVPIGSGQIDWPKVLRAAQEAGIKHYLIEDESPAVLEQLPKSLQYLESVNLLGGADDGRSALDSDPQDWMDLLPPADLAGWHRVTVPPGGKLGRAQWHVDAQSKTLVCDGDGGHDMLLTDKEFGDAIFHIEFRYTRIEGKSGYNSGVYVRNSRDGAIWHQAQIGDASGGYLFGETAVDGKPKFFTFTNDVKDPRVKPAGQWNTIEITARGNTLTLWVNGAVTCRYENCGRPKGHIGVEGEGYRIEFRNVKLKELK